jgi:hypothetical protein
VVAAVSIPVVLGLRAAEPASGQLQNLLVVVAATLSAAAALGLAWLIRPDLTLGGDGEWLLNVIRSRKPSDVVPMELNA